ncbi:iron ABC transporter permease [Xinfangfangia sp. D13-10-4-6]|uniref:FecCD family ABC transporter permease n=1 Tax=Pseudogemmobacter hezensis TaxID=2737662 RepID=UPI0015545096|nr:iron ABC transporter permease [Pseudogemmobacter hezensis]NPD15530.1 iron ABC transporter permease [Pseudogemmobacter hezensis]
MNQRSLSLPLLLVALLLAAMLLHLCAGAEPQPLSLVWSVLHGEAPDTFEAAIIRELRLPRALGAALAGAGLAAAGVLMQAVTRNPLAEPGLFGLLAGAALTVLLARLIPGLSSPGLVAPLAAAGSAFGAMLVFALVRAAGDGGGVLTPALAGAAVTAFLVALTTMISLMEARAFEDMRVWLSGSFAGLRLGVVAMVAPWALAGLGLALFTGPKLTILTMGDEAATGLGLNPRRIRALALIAVVVMTAAAVALAGPLGFVGLTVPHAVRLIGPMGQGRLLALSALAGAGYLVLADTLARTVIAPVEISAGILTALVGAPVLVLLVRMRA